MVEGRCLQTDWVHIQLLPALFWHNEGCPERVPALYTPIGGKDRCSIRCDPKDNLAQASKTMEVGHTKSKIEVIRGPIK